ncbi:MAG: carbohydrate kinase family protein [Anaerolineales bacterium]
MDEIIVFGNVTLDVICQTVDDVPRYESLSFDKVVLSPGGCASNVAVGLGALGIPTILICKTGVDAAADILIKKWKQFQLNLDYIKQIGEIHTAVSIGLVDHNAQPRFIHTPGANAYLSLDDLDDEIFQRHSIRLFHIGGFFVLPGLLDQELPQKLSKIRQFGCEISLDVVNSKRFWKAEFLFSAMPQLDYFLCNKIEATKLTGEEDVQTCAKIFRKAGARNAIIKIGAEGCYVDGEDFQGIVPTKKVPVVDTTGAGDAFAAGMLASLMRGNSLYEACLAGNKSGANVVQELGTITFWEKSLA